MLQNLTSFWLSEIWILKDLFQKFKPRVTDLTLNSDLISVLLFKIKWSIFLRNIACKQFQTFGYCIIYLQEMAKVQRLGYIMIRIALWIHLLVFCAIEWVDQNIAPVWVAHKRSCWRVRRWNWIQTYCICDYNVMFSRHIVEVTLRPLKNFNLVLSTELLT